MTQQEEAAKMWSQLLCLMLGNYNIDDIIWCYIIDDDILSF